MIAHLINQLPILVVVLPLVAAPLCVLLRQRTLVWALTVLVTWLCFAMAYLLLVIVRIRGEISYAVGGWPPPFGIELRLDMLNAIVLLLVTGVAAITSVYAKASVAAEIARERIYLFYALLLLNLCGLIGITVTNDAFNLFVFLEIASLSSYALIAMGHSRRALVSAFQYLIMGTIGATFILIGIGFLFVMTGTLNMTDIAQRLPPVMDTRTVKAALAFIVVGTSLKFALFPLHGWLPGAYAHAPSTVSAFIAATGGKVAIYAMIRFIFSVFGAEFAFAEMPLGEILTLLAVVAMLAASATAMFQTDLKRLLAWSSIAQLGYIVLGVALASAAGLTAAILHIVNHAVIKGAAFMAAGALFWQLRSTRLEDIAGLGRAMPWTATALVLAGLGLIGIPATAGFISKWYLLQALLLEQRFWLAGVILASSLFALVYVWRVVETLFLNPRADNAGIRIREAPLSMQLGTWLLVLVSIALGVYAAPLIEAAQRAAAALLGGP